MQNLTHAHWSDICVVRLVLEGLSIVGRLNEYLEICFAALLLFRHRLCSFSVDVVYFT